jgi:hypothetical protein
MNEYGYASGDPVNRKDPSGLTDCQKSRTSTNGGPWGSWTYYGNCSASDISPAPYLRTNAAGMWPMLPFLHNLPNYQGPGTHLRPGEGNKTQETTQADPPVGGEGQSSSGTNGASGGDSRTTSGVNGALSSISDSFKSIGDTWVGLATEDWDLVNRAYDYGPLGQTDDAGGVYYYGTRVGVYGAGAAGLTAGGLIVAEATGLTVIGSRPMQFFGNLGPEWHVGLEWATKKSVVHFGRHTVHGVHVAFGAVGPMVANFHIYLYPQVRFWWPGK